MSDILIDEFREALLGPCGVPRGAGLLVAMSGGRDSTVLLDLLATVAGELELQLCAATIDHGLRPDFADELAAAERACRVVDVPWTALSVTVTDEEIRRRGVEAAARAARQKALLTHADHHGAELIALGHHRQDQAETVLMRALVGTGLRWLAAMRARRGRWIRPQLDVAPQRLADHAEARGLRWIDDPTNHGLRFLRNRVRHRLLPRVEEVIGPGGIEQLARLAERCGTDERLLEQLAREAVAAARARDGGDRPRTDLPASALADLPEPLQVRALAGMARELEPEVLLRAVHLSAGAALLVGPDRVAGVDLPGGLRLERDGARLRALRRTPEPVAPEGPIELAEEGRTVWPAAGIVVRARVHGDHETVGTPPDAGSHRAWFDLDRLTRPLRVNTFAAGTRMRPFGGSGSRKVSDVLGEAGIPRRMRMVWPVVYDAREILWVPGARAADVARVVDQTHRILELSLESNR